VLVRRRRRVGPAALTNPPARPPLSAGDGEPRAGDRPESEPDRSAVWYSLLVPVVLTARSPGRAPGAASRWW
jgi:hypothetical protein